MSDEWHYAQEEKPIGPMSLEQLRAELKDRPDWKKVLVWRSGAREWQEAGTVVELAIVPPPLPKKEKAAASLSNSPKEQRSKWIIVGSLLLVILAAMLAGNIGREVGRAFIDWWRAVPNDGPWNDFRPQRYLTDEQVGLSQHPSTPGQAQPNPYEKFDPPATRLASDLHRALQRGVEETKRKLPYRADATTTLVDVYLVNSSVTYVYVVDETKARVTPAVAQDFRKKLTSIVCAPLMRRSMEAGAWYRYVYRDRKGRDLAILDFSKSSCGAR